MKQVIIIEIWYNQELFHPSRDWLGEVERMSGRRYFPWLLALTGLFVFRVLAQLILLFHSLPLLPPFEAWHGAVLPYPLLLACQMIIIAALSVITWRVGRDRVVARPWKYRLCFALGVPYFLFMAFRLVAGLTFLADHPWFSKSLPAFFHVVLASYLLLLGHHILTKARDPAGDDRG